MNNRKVSIRSGIAVAFSATILISSASLGAPKWKKIISSPSAGSSVSGFLEFNQDGSWTVPAGVTKVSVVVIGAGGGAGKLNIGGGGGGGGGSCVKRSSTVLVSANGGNGGGSTASATILPGPGQKVSESITVTPGETLNVFVGGGGGGGGNWGGSIFGGGGGYGACGTGGAGGIHNGGVAGGTSGSGLGGGGGSTTAVAGSNAVSSTGGSGAGNGGTGGAALIPGSNSSYGGGGGGTGGVGGFGANVPSSGYMGTSGEVGKPTTHCRESSTNAIFSWKADPGEPGSCLLACSGGGPGAVYLWW